MVDHNLVMKVCKAVFPAGSTFDIGETAAGGAASKFYVLPGPNGPRWIIPENYYSGWLALKTVRPYPIKSRLSWFALMRAYQAGILPMIPYIETLNVNISSDATWDHLGWDGQKSPPIPVIYIGTPVSLQKTVVQLISTEKNRVMSVSKIGLDPRSCKSVIQEADNLDALKLENPGITPELLYVDRNNGIATQSTLVGQPVQRELSSAHIDFLSKLKTDEETSLRAEAEKLSDWVAAQQQLEPQTRSVFEQGLQKIDDPTPMPAAWAHGDFAPWNLKQTKNGQVVAFDWEYAFRSALPLYDMVYHQTMTAHGFGHSDIFDKTSTQLINNYLASLHLPASLLEPLIEASILCEIRECHIRSDLRRSAYLVDILLNNKQKLQ